MQCARLFGIALLSAALIACGGKQAPSPGDPSSKPAGGDEEAVESLPGGQPSAADLPPIPDSPAPAPASLFASIAIGDPKGLISDLGTYVNAVVPGLGSTIGVGVYSDLAREIMSIELDGVDYGKPMWVLVLDPNEMPQPEVLVVAVSDGAALAKAAGQGGLLVQRHEGWAAVGSRSALEVGAGHALSALAAGAAPDKPEATLYVGAIMKRYEAQVRGVLPMIEAQVPPGPEGDAVRHLLSGLVSLVTQTELVRATLEVGGAASVEVEVVPRDGTDIGEFFEGQEPSSFAFMGQGSSPAFAFGGRMDWLTSVEFFEKLTDASFEKVYGGGSSMKELMHQIYGLMGGEIAVTGGVGAGGKIGFEGRWALSDAAKARKLLLRSMRELAKSSKKGKGGHFDYTFRARAFRHGRVPVARITSRPNKDATPEERDAYETVWGEGAVSSFLAFVGGQTVMAGGDGAKARVKGLIDRVQAKAPPEPPAATKAAIDAAKERKESMLLLFDVAAIAELSTGGAGLTPGGDPLVFGLGFDGGNLSLRLKVPAAQAKAFPKLAMQVP